MSTIPEINEYYDKKEITPFSLIYSIFIKPIMDSNIDDYSKIEKVQEITSKLEQDAHVLGMEMQDVFTELQAKYAGV